jgi:hypothetical protein
MDTSKINTTKERILEQIKKIDNKEFYFYFYIVDTKGNPSGSLSYIYDIAYSLKEMGYNVAMLHSEEDFIGVEEWMGKEYAELPHYNVEKKSVDITPSDILFIPEIYSNVMTATKNLPCQRVAILQSFDKLTEFIPFGAGWNDLGIFKAITTTETNAKRLKKYFPYVKTNIIKPKISSIFNNKNNDLKKLIVNVVTREPGDINKIVKPFFWQYPMYQWVAFRELRGLSREEFANALQEAAITVWVDDTTDFGYIPLESMKCGSIVVGKIPNVAPEWMIDNNEEEFKLTESGVWVDNLASLPSVLASVIRTWTMDEIPEKIKINSEKLLENYTEGAQLKDIKYAIIEKLVIERKNEYMTVLNSL